MIILDFFGHVQILTLHSAVDFFGHNLVICLYCSINGIVFEKRDLSVIEL